MEEPAANQKYPRDLELILMDYNIPYSVHLKFRNGTDYTAAVNEIGFLLSDFYDKQFRQSIPYPEFKKFGIKPGNQIRGIRVRHNKEGTLILWGKRARYVFHRGKYYKTEEEFRLGFFNTCPSEKEGFDYQMSLSRRVNDFTVQKYEIDIAASRKDAVDFYKYADGLLKAKKAGVAVTAEHR